MSIHYFNQKYPPDDGWGLTTQVEEVHDRLLVRAQLRDPNDRVIRSTVVEVGEGTVISERCKQARQELFDTLCLNDVSAQPKVDASETGTTAANPDAPDDFPVHDEPMPEPRPIEPIGVTESEPKAVTPETEVTLEPGPEGNEEPPSEALIKVLQQACDAENVRYRKPKTRRQCVAWTLALRQGNVKELADDLEPAEAPPEAEEAEEVAHA